MMKREAILQTAEAQLSSWIEQSEKPEPHRLDLTIDPSNLRSAVTALHNIQWGYLAAITGLDLGPETDDAIEALYHFCSGGGVVTLRVRLPRTGPTLPSICDAIPAAGFFERELSEMLGVTVVDLPTPARLFLPDDWPEDSYPLRKDFTFWEENER